MDLPWEEWINMYNTATQEKHDFLFIDMYAEDGYKMRKGLDTSLSYA